MALGLATISFATLHVFFRRDDIAFVSRRYERELDRVFQILAALLVPALCVEVVHKAVFFFSMVRVEPPIAITLPAVPWHWWPVPSWVYHTGVFLLVCVLF
jgi:protein-S-isoprenylcysteine O-methyltransferase Ste14